MNSPLLKIINFKRKNRKRGALANRKALSGNN